MKATVVRLSYMLSVYQLILTACVVFIPIIPKYISDCVRAMSVFIALGWTLLYIYGKNKEVLDMYRSLYTHKTPDVVFFIIDFCTHILPFLILGLPQKGSSYIVAAVLLMGWYTLVRSRTQFIYGNILTKKESDNVFYIIVPVVTAILFMVHHLQGAKTQIFPAVCNIS